MKCIFRGNTGNELNIEEATAFSRNSLNLTRISVVGKTSKFINKGSEKTPEFKEEYIETTLGIELDLESLRQLRRAIDIFCGPD